MKKQVSPLVAGAIILVAVAAIGLFLWKSSSGGPTISKSQGMEPGNSAAFTPENLQKALAEEKAAKK